MIERLKNHLQELKQTLARLTWKEKIEHLWIYYKHVLLIAGAVGFAIWFIIHVAVSSNQVTILSGTALNVYITDEGQTQIKNELTQDGQLEGDAFLDEFPYLDMYFVELGFLDEQTANYLVTRISSCNLDYILLDQSVLEVLGISYFIDMREIFPEEALARWPLIYKEDPESGERIPIGLDISQSGFVQDHMLAQKDLYMTATAGTVNREAFIRLADFFLSYESKTAN